MTEQTEAPDEATSGETIIPEREIDFRGRKLWVRLPGPEQLLVWKRTLSKLQNMETSDWTGDQVMAALERTRKIIDSLLINEADKDWLDDQMLESQVGLLETAHIIQLATEAFQVDGNREQRRAAAKPKKAARRKAGTR